MGWKTETEPLSVELAQAREALKHIPGNRDIYLDQLILYIEFALTYGLSGQAVLDSCRDLAEFTDPWFEPERQVKIQRWEAAVTEAQAKEREPRMVQMHLEPEYFSGIRKGDKFYEGRAWDPNSDKKYPDIRKGDMIKFTIDHDMPGWVKECRKWGVDGAAVMTTRVSDIQFGSSVHWLFQNLPGWDVGAEFQPYKNGVTELLQLRRAAAYYAFPHYRERIEEYGFIGIGVVRET